VACSHVVEPHRTGSGRHFLPLTDSCFPPARRHDPASWRPRRASDSPPAILRTRAVSPSRPTARKAISTSWDAIYVRLWISKPPGTQRSGGLRILIHGAAFSPTGKQGCPGGFPQNVVRWWTVHPARQSTPVGNHGVVQGNLCPPTASKAFGSVTDKTVLLCVNATGQEMKPGEGPKVKCGRGHSVMANGSVSAGGIGDHSRDLETGRNSPAEGHPRHS